MAANDKIKWSLCAAFRVRDWEPHALVRAARDAVRGGASWVHLIDRIAPMSEELSAALATVLNSEQVPLVIAGDIGRALAVDGAGVHLGRRWADAAAARRLLGRGRLLGVTINRLSETGFVDPNVVDYCLFGPCQSAAPSDPAASSGAAESMRALAACVKALPIPVVAFGGMTPELAEQIGRAGAAGLASRAFLRQTDDVESAARALLHAYRLGA